MIELQPGDCGAHGHGVPQLCLGLGLAAWEDGWKWDCSQDDHGEGLTVAL